MEFLDVKAFMKSEKLARSSRKIMSLWQLQPTLP
jgi:hypothetical protein